jgi:hypothetical protein
VGALHFELWPWDPGAKQSKLQCSHQYLLLREERRIAASPAGLRVRDRGSGISRLPSYTAWERRKLAGRQGGIQGGELQRGIASRRHAGGQQCGPLTCWQVAGLWVTPQEARAWVPPPPPPPHFFFPPHPLRSSRFKTSSR